MKQLTVLAMIICIFILACGLFIPLYAEDASGNPAIDISGSLDNLNNESVSIRLSAIDQLETSGDARVFAALKKRLKTEKSPLVINRLIEATGKSGGIKAADTLIDIIKAEKNGDMRLAAMRAAAYIRSEKVARALLEVYEDEKETANIRMQAADSLTYQEPTDKIYDAFTKGAENNDPDIRKQSINDLGTLFGVSQKEKTIATLKKMSKDKDSRNQKAAKERLDILGVKEKQDVQRKP